MAKKVKVLTLALFRRNQAAELKIVELEVKQAKSLVQADLDDATASNLAFSLHSASVKLERVSQWVKEQQSTKTKS